MTIGELPPRGPDLRGIVLECRYQLDHVVGSGGSGDVYAAIDRRLRRSVTVKVLFPEHARDEEQRRRIRQEALLGAQVSHPNVAPILDHGEEICAYREALLFIVMPLLKGRTLRELVSGGPLPWKGAGVWQRRRQESGRQERGRGEPTTMRPAAMPTGLRVCSGLARRDRALRLEELSPALAHLDHDLVERVVLVALGSDEPGDLDRRRRPTGPDAAPLGQERRLWQEASLDPGAERLTGDTRRFCDLGRARVLGHGRAILAGLRLYTCRH